jgi:hypothetical protein
MKRYLPILATLLLSLGTAQLFAADAKEEVTAAAKKLQGGYSWSTTMESGFGQSTSSGKAAKDGTIWYSTKFGNNTTEIYIKSAEKAAIKMQDQEWRSLAELTSDGEQGRGRWLGRMVQNYKAPADEAANIASKTKELKKEGDVYSGDLTEEGAKDLLPFGGRRGANPPEIKEAKGSVKFWVKDGVLTKYELKLQGSMNLNGEDRDLGRVSTVEIKDAGATQVEVPEEAKKKLS